MKKVLFASVCALMFGANSYAADIIPPSNYDWSGFYLGAQFGYTWENEDLTLTPNGGTAYNTTHSNPNFLVGGVNAGYNWQESNFVFGVEADAEAKGLNNSYAIGAPFSGTTGTTQSNLQGSLRLRGGLALDRTLLYATGGVAIAQFNDTFSTPPTFFDNPSSTRLGWTIGAGVEQALSENWTARVEYRYTDFGTHSDNLNNFLKPPGFSTDRITDQTVRIAIDYKF